MRHFCHSRPAQPWTDGGHHTCLVPCLACLCPNRQPCLPGLHLHCLWNLFHALCLPACLLASPCLSFCLCHAFLPLPAPYFACLPALHFYFSFCCSFVRCCLLIWLEVEVGLEWMGWIHMHSCFLIPPLSPSLVVGRHVGGETGYSVGGLVSLFVMSALSAAVAGGLVAFSSPNHQTMRQIFLLRRCSLLLSLCCCCVCVLALFSLLYIIILVKREEELLVSFFLGLCSLFQYSSSLSASLSFVFHSKTKRQDMGRIFEGTKRKSCQALGNSVLLRAHTCLSHLYSLSLTYSLYLYAMLLLLPPETVNGVFEREAGILDTWIPVLSCRIYLPPSSPSSTPCHDCV